MKKTMLVFSVLLIMVFLGAFPMISYGTTYEDLVRTYIEKQEMRRKDTPQVIDLKTKAMNEEELWESLIKEEDPRRRVDVKCQDIVNCFKCNDIAH